MRQNPLKQGRVDAGRAHPDRRRRRALIERGADHCVILFAWNIADEIRRKQAAFTERGGHFVVPIPTLQVLS